MSPGPKRDRPAVHRIHEQRQLEALISPVRGLLLSNLCSSGPCSVGELARLVGRKPRALYYHLEALVDAGLVEEVGTRPTQRRRETLYDAIADIVEVDEHFLDTPEWADAHRRTAAAMFRQGMRAHLAALDDKTFDTGSPSPEVRLHTSQVQLTKEGIRRLNDKVGDLLQTLREERDKRQGRFFTLMLHFCPVVDAQVPGDDFDESD